MVPFRWEKQQQSTHITVRVVAPRILKDILEGKQYVFSNQSRYKYGVLLVFGL